jgi:hypothetical protein
MIQCVRDLDLTFKSNGLHALSGRIYIVMVAHVLHASRLICKKKTQQNLDSFVLYLLLELIDSKV